MIIFVLGYFVMGLMFLVLRAFYHIWSKNNLIPAMKKDFAELYAYEREIFLSNPIKFKMIAVIIACFIISTLMPLEIEIVSLLSAIIYFLMLITYAPQKIRRVRNFRSKFSVLSIQSC